MPTVKEPMRLPARTSTIYPAPYDKGFDKRLKRALTGPLGLTQFGVNLTVLEPGGQTALRHWHAREDECVYVVSGEVVLITDAGETALSAGMFAGFPAGVPDGHHLVNRSSAPVTLIEIGTRSEDEDATYPDDDLTFQKRGGSFRFFHKSGEPYE